MHAKKIFRDVKPGIDLRLRQELLAQSCNRRWPDFATFTACEKSRFGLKRAKRHNAFQTVAKIYLNEKIVWG